jgi:hypothetical protein
MLKNGIACTTSATAFRIMLQPVINQAVQHAFPVLHRGLQQTSSQSFIARFAARQCRHPVPSRACATAATAQQGPAAPTGVPSTIPSAPSSSGSGKSRAYPDEPRVGVGVVVFRKPVNKAEESPEVCGWLLCGSDTAAQSVPGINMPSSAQQQALSGNYCFGNHHPGNKQ